MVIVLLDPTTNTHRPPAAASNPLRDGPPGVLETLALVIGGVGGCCVDARTGWLRCAGIVCGGSSIVSGMWIADVLRPDDLLRPRSSGQYLESDVFNVRNIDTIRRKQLREKLRVV